MSKRITTFVRRIENGNKEEFIREEGIFNAPSKEGRRKGYSEKVDRQEDYSEKGSGEKVDCQEERNQKARREKGEPLVDRPYSQLNQKKPDILSGFFHECCCSEEDRSASRSDDGTQMTSPRVSLTARNLVPSKHPVLRWSVIGLVASSWLSAAVFGAYILAFYIFAIPAHLSSWNDNLPGLYEKGNTSALIAMSTHLLAGAIILVLGPIQLMSSVRQRWPALHSWLGRVYVLTAGVAGLGGLGFILTEGTIGGPVMNAGFGLYGILVTLAAIETYRHARALRFETHRAWAIRLFALAVGSWLYRMDYGFWLIAAHRLGHTSNFHGPFDVVMSFFFYVPNLIVAELFLRAERLPSNFGLRFSAGTCLNVASLIVLIGTYYFTRFYWGPAILNSLRSNL